MHGVIVHNKTADHGVIGGQLNTDYQIGHGTDWRMEARRNDANEPWEELKAIHGGWMFGAEDFLGWILERVEVEAKGEHPRPPRDETEQGKALRIIRDEMELLGWTATDLHRRHKGDPRKIAIARRLRKETAVTAKWVAEAKLELHQESTVSLRRVTILGSDPFGTISFEIFRVITRQQFYPISEIRDPKC